ncbi:MAG: insulinase family protein [Deltaproteobacteria bacterium]|nr:insulinase family protein [Deltaproteobacteria bacterium]
MSDPAEVTLHTLQNGVQVWISENHEEPRVAARIAVRAGAAFDPPEFGGVAHALEHMLANKGSRRLGVLDARAEAPHLARARALARERPWGIPPSVSASLPFCERRSAPPPATPCPTSSSRPSPPWAPGA